MRPTMRRLALLVLVFAFPSTAAAAELTVAPYDFSPKAKRLTVRASLPSAARVGLQLATEGGRPIGWIVPPQRRRFLTLSWNGRLDGRSSPTAATSSGSSKASPGSPLPRSASTPPAPTPEIDAHNRSRAPSRRQPAVHDHLPNGDKPAGVGQNRVPLSERARVHFEVTRTVSSHRRRSTSSPPT